MPSLRDRTAAAPRRRPLDATPAPAEALAALIAAGASQPVLLDSAAAGEPHSRYSVLAGEPSRTLLLRGDELRLCAGRSAGRVLWRVRLGAVGSIHQPLRKVLAATMPAQPGPYGPGWLGYLGYELGRHFERLPGRAVRDTSLPDLQLGLYEAVAVHDSHTGRWELAHLPGAEAEAERLACAIASAEGAAAPAPSPAGPPEQLWGRAETDPDHYRRAIARCIDYIAAGDIFQVNLSQRFLGPCPASPLSVYRRLRSHNPAGYAAFLADGDWAICSSSPELFLSLRRGRVTTRPIKGTIARGASPEADRAAGEALLASAKDNAELAMIVDLLRNDLGRVCQFGSVKVACPRRLEAHPTVWHLVATVQSQLRATTSSARLLAATFPGGSITGAPKIRAMEIIDQFESAARGVYTGCIGYLGLDGSAELNIAIRTAVIDRGRAIVQAGGGIVADSEVDIEYDETLAKARAVREAIGQTCQSAG